MQRLLFLPLLLGFTSALNAETIWLVVKTHQCNHGCGVGLEKIEMASMEQCHRNGRVWIHQGLSEEKPEKSDKAIWHTTYKCLKGK